jgi:hypothetical protein
MASRRTHRQHRGTSACRPERRRSKNRDRAAGLETVVATASRPIVFWVGAGSSKWLGFPSWKELTLALRKDFARSVASFDNQRALERINKSDFPAVFQMCRDLDEGRYFSFIANAFLPRNTTDIYQRFLNLLAGIASSFVISTNVDEALEANRPTSITVQRSDFTRCIDLVQNKRPFVAKIHGSISSVKSTVFTTTDYNQLLADQPYLQTLKYIFATCTVVFLSYGVRDSHVLRLLSENAAENNLFGPGPHFVVTNEPIPVESLHRIGYDIKLNPDHKAALSVLEHIR